MKKILLFFLLVTINQNVFGVRWKIGNIFYDLDAKKKTALVDYQLEVPNSVIIPEIVEYEGVQYTVIGIKGLAFRNCTNLISVAFPKSLKTIYEDAFDGCTNLKRIEFPESKVRCTLKSGVFRNCKNIESILCYCEMPPLGEYSSFEGEVYAYSTLYVPEQYMSKYNSWIPWSRFHNRESITIENGVTEIRGDETIKNVSIYTIDGRIIKMEATQEDVQTLEPGLYIVNGEKIIINK